jgi:cysteine-S-conjugate beta-lyase
MFDFDQPLPHTELSTMKWGYEIERTGDPSLLCFGTADMDFKAPPAGHLGYPYKTQAYYDAIQGFYTRRFGWEIQREWIRSNVGVYTAMQPLFEELTQPGDEVVYQPPVHFVFRNLITAMQRTPLANPLVRRAGRYEMDFDGLERLVTPRTKLFLLCSPHNPVGRVWTRDELLRLHNFCAARGILIIADEVYCGLLYPGVAFTPMGAVAPDAAHNTVTLMSASKSFNVTGLKHAFLITANVRVRDAYMAGIAKNSLNYGESIFGIEATEAALRDCDDWSTSLMRYVRDNHAFTTAFLREHLPDVGVTTPESTYFAWLDFSKRCASLGDLRAKLETQARVIVAYGEPLGPGGEGHVRLNLGAPRATIEAGLRRIAAVFGH